MYIQTLTQDTCITFTLQTTTCTCTVHVYMYSTCVLVSFS